MPRRMIYVREGDQPVWDQAERLAGEESLSALVTEALRRFILAQDHKEGQSPYKRIELSVRVEDDETEQVIGNRITAFRGRLLVDGPITVYETAKHKLLFYFNDANGYGSFRVFDSLQEATETRAWEEGADGELMFRGELIAKVGEALGTPWIEELDI